jgi:hypothetical protein
MKGYIKQRRKMLDHYANNLVPVDWRRGTGRSTVLALRYVARALSEPGKVITIFDHYPTRAADRMLMDMCKDVCARMELEGFVFNAARVTITFKGYE